MQQVQPQVMILKQKYTAKVTIINTNDLVLKTNDVNTANIISEWYKTMTGRKVHQGKGSKFIKCAIILEGARKDSAFNHNDWPVIVGDKMLECGYKLVGVSGSYQFSPMCAMFTMD